MDMGGEVVSLEMQGHTAHHVQRMRNMVNNKEFSNVTFMVGPCSQEIYANRGILAAHCALFRAMFEDDDFDKHDMKIELRDMPLSVFLVMMEFIYTNLVKLDSSNIVDILAVSLEYGLDDLRNLCVEFMISHLTVTSACDVMQASVTFNQNDLKATAMTFIENNTSDVLCAANFKDLSEDALVTIAASPKLTVDEIDLIKAVRNWASINSAINGTTMYEIAQEAIKQLKLPLLSDKELVDLEGQCKKEKFIPVAKFVEARNIHKIAETQTLKFTKRKGTAHRDHHKYFITS